MATSLRYPKGHAFFDNNGVLLAGGSLEYFRAGTSTAQGIFSDADGMVALPNPVTLNSAGRAVDGSATPVAVYLSDADGFDYKEEIANSTGTVLYTDDDIPSPVDPGASLSDFAKPTTAWSTDTNATVNLAVGDAGTGRLASTGSNSITYNLPSASAFVNGRPITIKKTSASNTVTLDADGTDTIDGAGTFAWTANNRAYKISSDGANWRVEADYVATPDAASDTSAGVLEIAVQSEMEAAASTILAVTPARQQHHPAHPKAWAKWNGNNSTIQASHGVSSITDNGTGDFTLNWATAFASANYAVSTMTAAPFTGVSFIGTTQRGDVAPTTAAFRFVQANDGGAAADSTWTSAMAIGDQ